MRGSCSSVPTPQQGRQSYLLALSSNGLGRGPLKAEIRVRFPLRLPSAPDESVVARDPTAEQLRIMRSHGHLPANLVEIHTVLPQLEKDRNDS